MHRRTPVQLEACDTNRCAHACTRPQAAWLNQAEDLGKLILWAANRAGGSNTSVDDPDGAVAFAGDSNATGWSAIVEEGRKLFRELDDPAELLRMLQAQVAAVFELMPAAQTGLLYLLSGSLAKLLQLMQLLLSFGGTAVVFITMTFYMLSSEEVMPAMHHYDMHHTITLWHASL